MATVKIVLDKRRALKDGSYPIVFRITNKNSATTIHSGYSAPEEFFSSKLVHKNCPNIPHVPSANMKLLTELNELELFIDKQDRYLLSLMSATEIKNKYIAKKEVTGLSFDSYLLKYASSRVAPTTGKLFRDTLDIMSKFKAYERSFSDITFSYLVDLESWMKSRGNGTNYIGIHFRNIRTIFNSAIDEDIIDQSIYPFRKYKIKKQTTKKRNIALDEIALLRDVSLSGVPEIARDIFMLIFYLVGINLKDLVHAYSLTNGRLDYTRLKGKKEYSIKVEPEALEIINKYRGEKYLLRLMEHYTVYENCRKEIDKKLKVAARKAGITENISTYYARHSWATIAASCGISKDDISLSLGHTNGDVTETYIDWNREKIDIANRTVLDALKCHSV